ncbi:MAG: response regulator transcription factor [Psychrosphaera sp.]|nr:response regulator transcription factor [Psychrosphaera sp.]
MNILIVEDEKEHVRIVKTLFETMPLVHQLDVAYNYEQALTCLSDSCYNVALVDIRLKDRKDGIDLCQHIRRTCPDTIVILLTGYDETAMLKASYEAGCFDYLRKPYSRVELRLKVLRWAEMMQCKYTNNKRLEYQGLSFDFDKAAFVFNGEQLKLSKSCKRLLLIFIKTPEKLVTRPEIQRQLWGDHECSIKKRDIADRVRSLRQQLPKGVAKWIVAVTGEGYALQKNQIPHDLNL